MRIIVSQQNKKLSVKFFQGKVVDNYAIDKAEEFLVAVDKFLKKSKISPTSSIRPISHIGPIGRIGRIEFENTGMLTERIIRAIIMGLRF